MPKPTLREMIRAPRGAASVASFALASLVGACAMITPAQTPSPHPGTDIAQRTSPVPRRPGETETSARGSTPNRDSRPTMDQVCRTRAMPIGYVAVDFVSDEARCPASRTSSNPFTAAIIMRIDTTPVGQTLEVCADQAMPRDWLREGTVDGNGRCPRASDSPDASPTMVRIRRLH